MHALNCSCVHAEIVSQRVFPVFVHVSFACDVGENSSAPAIAGTDDSKQRNTNELETVGEESNDGISLGLALGLVSCCVLLDQVDATLGKNAIWAVLTTVAVFECTVGATLSRGLNRGLGTFLAASAALGIDFLAHFIGGSAEPNVVGVSIFVVGMITTYARFFPAIKARYDYGMVMFCTSFCLVVVSGYRASDNIKVALDRMFIVILGCAVCVVVSLFIFPVWAGDDLHNLIVNNCDDLADSIEACTAAYFNRYDKHAFSRLSSKSMRGEAIDDIIYRGYKTVLLSKQTEENLANQACYEPWHGRFGCMYPWQKCLEVGTILRHCAYTVCALHGCVLSEIQAPNVLREIFSQPCMYISSEVVRVLRESAVGLRECCKTQRSKQSMIESLRSAVLHLHDAMESYNSQVAGIHDMATSSASDNNDSEMKAHLDNMHDGHSPEAPTNSSSLYVSNQQQNHQYRRLFSASVLNAGYCLPDLRYDYVPPVNLDNNDERMRRCRKFTECLSVTTVATLLIELVSRLEPLLTAIAELEEKAFFKDVAAPDVPFSRRPNLRRYNTEKLIVQHATAEICPF
ncbi:hypothetical protein KP509_06G086400 [Ceratopteris richardii]|uniref:Aluminum-activated malate transporter n=1 Tax=Ceratopteris richardii TaxID=49495 RepID=A0A8T2UN47_CERRI|nr:hypothetical protein KP509_06G086400 [Ceratopteris richardii]